MEVGANPVPEPETWALFGAGLRGLGWLRWRKPMPPAPAPLA